MENLHVTIGEKHVKHIEGDVWTEGGKLWTIKNGIKRTVSKMDEARKQFSTPLACPKCNGSMKHYLDEKMWAIHKTCFNCVIDADHEIQKAGKWAEYEKAKIMANADSFVKDLISYMEDYNQEGVAKAHVTENGQVEKWRDADQTEIKKITDSVIEDITKKVEDYKESN